MIFSGQAPDGTIHTDQGKQPDQQKQPEQKKSKQEITKAKNNQKTITIQNHPQENKKKSERKRKG